MILMKGEKIELKLKTQLDALKRVATKSSIEDDDMKKLINEEYLMAPIDALCNQINFGYDKKIKSEKKSETVNFYNSACKFKDQLDKFTKGDYNPKVVKAHMCFFVEKIDEFVQILKTQQKRKIPIGKSRLANGGSINELTSLSKILGEISGKI